MVSLLSVVWMQPVAAQNATPQSSDGHINLAAMALPTKDLPDGFALSIENYQSGQAYAENIFSDQRDVTRLLNTGLSVIYDSQYTNETGDEAIRSYIEQYDSVNGATSGFRILEDESSLQSTSSTYSDQPLEGVGDNPGEITTYRLKAQNDNPATDGVDVTFRVDTYIVGVTIESTNGAPPAQADAITRARALQTRVQAVLNGDEIQGIDRSLPLKLLEFAPVNEGYVSDADTYGPAATAELFKAYQSGYTRAGLLGQGASALPLLTDTVSTWAAEDGVLALISGGDQYQPAYPETESVDIDPIAGATAVAAFHFVSPLGNRKAIDSYRILATDGDDLITIEVQSAENEAIAKGLAIKYAKAQLACLDTGTCPQIGTGS